MSSGDLEDFEAESELALYREYRDVYPMFRFAVETDQRFYLCNSVEVEQKSTATGQVYFEIQVEDAWIWDSRRTARFLRSARVTTFKDLSVEELASTTGPDFTALS
ncbi:MAG TPA: DUF2469 domain-containing protein [Actinobacteria bacterium]|nr:DUF2469 domain-containing protein [Actinomycetota bacterium]HCK79200.1 DUF2469 domain-containing protein [Actinomycetota bacterium]